MSLASLTGIGIASQMDEFMFYHQVYVMGLNRYCLILH
ncbi:hypothetical protein GGI1_21909 [Acidithiobacillus sp. GGI-221]|nr:hypothetical protein GGI1_21909 [Acidithiobacillus sp. GGI-221]